MDRVLVLGIGNDLLGDDGVGPVVVRRVKKILPPELRGVVDVEEAATAGFDLIDYLRGYDRAVVVDAIKTDGGAPGTVYRFAVGALRPTAHLGRIHGINLAGALSIAEQLNIPIPKEITVVAVEAAELYTFGKGLTPAVAAAVEEAAQAVLAAITTETILNKDG